MALANNSLINHFSYVFAVLFEPDFEIHSVMTLIKSYFIVLYIDFNFW